MRRLQICMAYLTSLAVLVSSVLEIYNGDEIYIYVYIGRYSQHSNIDE